MPFSAESSCNCGCNCFKNIDCVTAMHVVSASIPHYVGCTNGHPFHQRTLMRRKRYEWPCSFMRRRCAVTEGAREIGSDDFALACPVINSDFEHGGAFQFFGYGWAVILTGREMRRVFVEQVLQGMCLFPSSTMADRPKTTTLLYSTLNSSATEAGSKRPISNTVKQTSGLCAILLRVRPVAAV